MRELDDINSRRLSELAKADRDAADVVQWLRQNRHRFQKEIIEPAYLSITVTDKKFATAVEACLNWNDLRVSMVHSESCAVNAQWFSCIRPL